VFVSSIVDCWDFRYNIETEDDNLILELCIAVVKGPKESSEIDCYAIGEVGLVYYDPQSYSGFSFHGTPPGKFYRYSITPDMILGRVCGYLDYEDHGVLRKFLGRIVRQYRSHLQSLYEAEYYEEEEINAFVV